jgi:ribosomal protein S18 acetylase RimI-like enzyme
MELVGPHLQRATECEAVLRSLPRWFGIERALLMFATDTERFPTFALAAANEVAGFITLHEHFPDAWEIHCIAVRADARNRGYGSHLLTHAEGWLCERGAKYLQVKTVAHTSPSAEYGETRAFYRTRGFTPIEVFPTLWDPHNPALQLIKVLRAG